MIIESFEGAARGMDKLLAYAGDPNGDDDSADAISVMTFGDILKVYATNNSKADFSYLANLGIQNTLSNYRRHFRPLRQHRRRRNPASIIETAYKASDIH